MKKSECEPHIRRLCREWVATLPDTKKEHPSFSSFKEWLRGTDNAQYLYFRSVAGAEFDAEVWFDQELGQMWRR